MSETYTLAPYDQSDHIEDDDELYIMSAVVNVTMSDPPTIKIQKNYEDGLFSVVDIYSWELSPDYDILYYLALTLPDDVLLKYLKANPLLIDDFRDSVDNDECIVAIVHDVLDDKYVSIWRCNGQYHIERSTGCAMVSRKVYHLAQELHHKVCLRKEILPYRGYLDRSVETDISF